MQRAQQVLLEIARQSPGDEVKGKTKLFKIFYFAHLFYAAESPGYLTEWPIVRMPLGPGIEQFDSLISDLVRKGMLICESIRIGPYPSEKYRAVAAPSSDTLLADDEIEAIRKAVEFASDKTAEELSAFTHEYSRAWNESDEMGQELNIYKDLLTDDEHSRRLQDKVSQVEAELDGLWQA